MKRKGIFVPTHQVEPSLRNSRSMSRRNQIQSDSAGQHTHDSLLGRRERFTVRAGLAIPRRVQQGQPCWQFSSDWFLDLPHRVCVLLCFIINRYWGIVTVPVSIPYGSRPGVAGSSPFTLNTSLVMCVCVVAISKSSTRVLSIARQHVCKYLGWANFLLFTLRY